jgi:hypothetical protein
MKVTDGTRAGFSEVRFDVKPPESVRDALKAAGFRWSGHNACWYGRTDRLPAFIAEPVAPTSGPSGPFHPNTVGNALRAAVAATEPAAAPCPVRDRLAAEPSAELAAIRAELSALRAHIAGLKAATTSAVTVDTSGDVRPAPVPVTVPQSAPVRPVPIRAPSPVRSGSIGRTIAVDAGKWA